MPKRSTSGCADDKQSLPFMYLQQSDSHCRFPGGCAAFAAFVNHLGSEVKFVLDTGDTSFGSEGKDGPTTFRVLTEAERKFKAPFLHAIGNHDVMGEGNGEFDGLAAWTRNLGPLRWSFDYADVHFAGIDCFEEAMRPVVVNWLEKDFRAKSKGRRIVLCHHYPNPDGDRFHALLKDYNVQLVQAGHNHASKFWDDWYAAHGHGVRLQAAGQLQRNGRHARRRVAGLLLPGLQRQVLRPFAALPDELGNGRFADERTKAFRQASPRRKPGPFGPRGANRGLDDEVPHPGPDRSRRRPAQSVCGWDRNRRPWRSPSRATTW